MGLGRPPIDDPLYNIGVSEKPGTSYAFCSKQEASARPVGYMDDEPICDLCLLELATDLDPLLVAVSVVRVYATSSGTPEQHAEALEEFGAFARI